MDVIYKYNILCLPETKVVMPMHAEILAVKEQNEGICMWVKINKDVVAGGYTEERNLKIVGTGEDVCLKGCNYLDTVILQRGDFVAHVYEKVEQI